MSLCLGVSVAKKLVTSSEKSISWFEYILLGVCLCVLAIRTTYTENINSTAANPWMNINDDFISLIFSGILLLTAAAWWVYVLFRRDAQYRFTGLEIGAVLFAVGGLIGIAVASNKRAAINDFSSLLIPILTAVMLVQILNSHTKIRIVLIVLVSVAAASAFQCVGQYFVDMQMMIEQYETDPQSVLIPLGITPGSFEQMLFEHRLYTKGVSGFLTTRNSVGSFGIIACFAGIALFAEQIKKYLFDRKAFWPMAACGSVLIISFFNLIIPRSKGAILAFILAFIIFLLLIKFPKIVSKHRKIILTISLIILIAAIFFVFSYGKQKLPGGSSMLVRWQYWISSVQMYKDNAITGVGPGNFRSHYSQYKFPAALEDIKEPHNFILSLLIQYGPIGLSGFLLMLAACFYRGLGLDESEDFSLQEKTNSTRRILLALSCIITVTMLLVRPIVKPPVINDEPFIGIFYAVLVFYIAPASAFLLGFWLANGLFKQDYFKATNLTAAALIAAYIGLLVHNLIDFAIFEMGIYTSLWFVLAALLAVKCLNTQSKRNIHRFGLSEKIIAAGLYLIMFVLFLAYGLVPVCSGTKKIRLAQNLFQLGRFEESQKFFETAADADRFNPLPYSLKGRLALQEYNFYIKSQELLLSAEKSFLAAIERDKADYKNYELLADTYEFMDDAEKALEACKKVIELYPGLDRGHLKFAQLAERLGENALALEHYKKAVEIEDAYREQFKIMYPGKKVFSRLGEKNYELAVQRIADLEKE